MAEDLTPKQEAFCLAYIETGNATEAYRRAYDSNAKDSAINVEACKLLKHPKIALRLQALHQANQKRNEITVDYLTDQLKAVLQKAMTDDKGASAAVSAIVALGKLHGLIVDRKHVAGEIDHKHTHATEPVSETADWVAGVLRAGPAGKAAKPLPN
jgi:phage terminase small subunit